MRVRPVAMDSFFVLFSFLLDQVFHVVCFLFLISCLSIWCLLFVFASVSLILLWQVPLIVAIGFCVQFIWEINLPTILLNCYVGLGFDWFLFSKSTQVGRPTQKKDPPKMEMKYEKWVFD